MLEISSEALSLVSSAMTRRITNAAAVRISLDSMVVSAPRESDAQRQQVRSGRDSNPAAQDRIPTAVARGPRSGTVRSDRSTLKCKMTRPPYTNA